MDIAKVVVLKLARPIKIQLAHSSTLHRFLFSIFFVTKDVEIAKSRLDLAYPSISKRRLEFRLGEPTSWTIQKLQRTHGIPRSNEETESLLPNSAWIMWNHV